MMCGSELDSSSLVKYEVVSCCEHHRFTHSYRLLWLEISRKIKFPFPLSPPTPNRSSLSTQWLEGCLCVCLCVLNRITGGRALSK